MSVTYCSMRSLVSYHPLEDSPLFGHPFRRAYRIDLGVERRIVDHTQHLNRKHQQALQTDQGLECLPSNQDPYQTLKAGPWEKERQSLQQLQHLSAVRHTANSSRS